MADNLEPQPPRPGDPISDNDRAPALYRVKQAIGSDALQFAELDDRFDSIYAATTRAELEAVVADLPTPAAPQPARPEIGHPAPQSKFSLIGDIEISGWLDVDGDLQVTNLVGDTTIDLSSASLPDEVVVTVNNLIGDRRIIVPDGARAVLEGGSLLGDSKVLLAEARPGMPTIRVKGLSLVGDIQLYSLSRVPEKLFRRLWKKLKGPTT